MILQISFDALVSPETFTVEIAILFSTLIFVMLYATLRYRSLFGLFGWVLMIVALMLFLFTNIQLLWFWLAVIGEAILLMFAGIEYTRAAARGNN